MTSRERAEQFVNERFNVALIWPFTKALADLLDAHAAEAVAAEGALLTYDRRGYVAGLAGEREACARVAAESGDVFLPQMGASCLFANKGHMPSCHAWIAAAIRARGKARTNA